MLWQQFTSLLLAVAQSLKEFVTKYSNVPSILLGDFNAVVDSCWDRMWSDVVDGST